MTAVALSPITKVVTALAVPKTIAAELRPAVDWSKVEIVDSRLLPPNDWTPPPAVRDLSPTLRIDNGVLLDENNAWVCPFCQEGDVECHCNPVMPKPVATRKPATQRTPEEIVRDTNRALAQMGAVTR